jgi:aspartate/tyrosine/aromatic aminotransferase
MAIVTALAEKLRTIDGSGSFRSDVSKNVSERLLFWDEVKDFPAVHLNAGTETRTYQGGGYKDRFLTITIRIYVQEEDSTYALEKVIEDVETILEDNSRLAYVDQDGVTQYTQQISILTIDTDEGVLDPLGVAEISCEVRY